MKYSPQQYAHAFYDIAENKKGSELKVAVQKCADFLSKAGDTAKSREIIAEVQKISDIKNRVERIHLESSEKPDSESLKKNFKKGTVVMWKQNKKAIAGATITVKDERVNNTVKGRIEKMRETFIN